jgi:hypothetical protein
MRRRSVAEFCVVTGNPKSLDESERREQLRLFKEDLGENFLVKKVQAPGPKPDEVNQENREDDQEQRDQPERPFQNASEHSESVVWHTRCRSMFYLYLVLMIVIETTSLRLVPHAPEHLRALVEGADAYTRSSGLTPANGLRDFIVSPEVSAEWLEMLSTATNADPWKFGIKDNEKVLKTIIRFADEQGLLAKKITIDDLFIRIDEVER